MRYEMKPLFKQRMETLLPDKEDFEKYNKIIHIGPESFIRCNTIKIPIEKLLSKLKKKWNVVQPFSNYPEIMLVNQNLEPGELGNSLEHTLGYYYIQEISSMLPPLALDPKPNELILDLCASPGSKTSQIAMYMQNQGTIIANDLNIGRIKILSTNLEKCGVTNAIITRKDAIGLCASLSKSTFPKFDKILVDAPCSGEGTLRSSPKTFLMWNPKLIKKFSRQQKTFVAFALKCLKKGGTLVYSTCTHAPEENEEVVDFALKNFPVKIEKISLPLKTRQGITSWNNKSYHNDVKHSCRIYPQDNNSEGFFVAKMTLLEEVK
ncbi:RsmB/NOP family class I SAM-dependent RNA methyltransferase [Candidatus Pacearchaeota archaeon]|nr:RsmB/NOP family class I SAM-dependent RNA methyltransferase [Candidatus Pacearchaeota archaeon]